MCSDYFEAQDLAQDTFLAAYKNLAFFDGQYERAWLTKIAVNKCMDYQKHSARRSVPVEDIYFSDSSAAGSLPQSQYQSPESEFLEEEVKNRLYQCCQLLKSPYREVATDYFYHELPIQEIARATGKNLKTLQTQVYRAKGMLRKLYRREELTDG